MNDYAWRALDAGGRERRGRLRAESADAARARLEARRYYVVALEQGGGASPALFSRVPRLSSRELMLLTRQLATLSQVAPLDEALRIIAQQHRRGAIVRRVHDGLARGLSLAEAMGEEPGSFPPLYRAMIAAGERSGRLPQLMERLAAHLERQAQVRGRVVAAVAYPAAIALIAVAVVIGLMLFVVPRVVEQFDDMGQALPLLTRAVIGLSAFLSGWGGLVLLMLLIAGCVWMAKGADRVALRLPFLGRLIRDLHAARLARTLATMVGGHLPLVEGLRLTAPTIRNRTLRAATGQLAEAVRGGRSLAGALRDAAIFPPILVHMASAGEASGRLELMLERAADYLERELDALTATVLALLEPAIIVVMGALVALIVLSILLPILQLALLQKS